jgi:hypothetical protein
VTCSSIRTVRIETTLGNIEVWDQTNEPEENVRLIAAAPEVLAALKAALPFIRVELSGSSDEDIVRQCEAAIAKAEGR